MESTYIISGIIALFFLFILGNYITILNVRNQTKKAWDDFEEQFVKKIRVATEIIKEVMQYAAYEKDLVGEILKARKKAEEATTFEEKKEAGNILSMILKSVFAVSEKYPGLKASRRFMELKKQLEEIEEGIESAKKIYLESLDTLKKLSKKRPFSTILSFFKKEKEGEAVDEKPKKVKVNRISKNKNK